MANGPVGVIWWASAASALPNQTARPATAPIAMRFIEVSFTVDPPGRRHSLAQRKETSAIPGPNFREIAQETENGAGGALQGLQTKLGEPCFRSPGSRRRGAADKLRSGGLRGPARPRRA